MDKYPVEKIRNGDASLEYNIDGWNFWEEDISSKHKVLRILHVLYNI